MGHRFLMRLTAFATAMALVVLGAGVAFADVLYVVNDVATGSNASVAQGGTGSAQLWLNNDRNLAGNAGDESGCNVSVAEPGTLTLTSSAPSIVAVTAPGTAQIVDCGTANAVSIGYSVSSTAAVGSTATVSATITGGKTHRDKTYLYDTSDTMTVTVIAGTVDPCNTAAAPAAPTFTAGDPNGDNGWFKTTVPTAAATSSTTDAVISYSTDGGTTFGSLPTLGQGTTTVIAKATAATCATKSSTTSRTFKVDTGDPTIGHTITGASPAASGWYTTAPTVTFQCADTGGSGVASCVVDGSDPASASVTLGDGADQSVSGTAIDLAGNQGSDTASDIDVDTVNPTVSVTGFVDGASYTLGQTLPTPGCDADDATSGIDAAETDTTPSQSGTLGTNGTGTLTFTCDATDNAGRTNSASKSFSIAYGGDATTGMRILQPINSDNTSVFSRGKVIPVKFKLAGDEPVGFDVTGWRIERSRVSCTNMDDEGLAAEPVAASNPAGLRYDSGADQYTSRTRTSAMRRSGAAGRCGRSSTTARRPSGRGSSRSVSK